MKITGPTLSYSDNSLVLLHHQLSRVCTLPKREAALLLNDMIYDDYHGGVEWGVFLKRDFVMNYNRKILFTSEVTYPCIHNKHEKCGLFLCKHYDSLVWILITVYM